MVETSWGLESHYAMLCYMPFLTKNSLLNCCTFSHFWNIGDIKTVHYIMVLGKTSPAWTVWPTIYFMQEQNDMHAPSIRRWASSCILLFGKCLMQIVKCCSLYLAMAILEVTQTWIIILRPVCTMIGLNLDWMCIAWNWFLSSLVNPGNEMWACLWIFHMVIMRCGCFFAESLSVNC